MKLRHPRPLPRLLTLLEAQRGGVDARIGLALDVLVEQLGVDTAFVSRFVDGQRQVTHVAGESLPAAAGVPIAVQDTICRLVATGAVPALVTDTAVNSLLAGHPHVARFGIGTYAGVPLVVDGEIVGAVCAVAGTPLPGLSQRDADRLATAGEFIGQVLTRSERRLDVPDQPDEAADEHGVRELAQVVAGGDDLESLARGLLELLHASTGLESTYLTFVDWAGDRQKIVHSFNTGRLAIPEGLSVPWSDTLCRRALDDGIPYTRDVPQVWGDSEAARQLGIQTYISVPITDADQAMIGTLCGASSASVELDEQHLSTMQLFGLVLAEQISRDRSGQRQQDRAQLLAQHIAELRGEEGTDTLTGLPNRLGIQQWLAAVIPTLQAGTEQLAIAFVDIDGFASFNDTFGSDAGDDILRRLAGSLSQAARPQDLQGRWAGDQFVTAAVLASSDASFGDWTHRQSRAAAVLHRPGVPGVQGTHQPGEDVLVRTSVGVITVLDPATGAEHAVHLAEQVMLRRKSRLAGSAG